MYIVQRMNSANLYACIKINNSKEPSDLTKNCPEIYVQLVFYIWLFILCVQIFRAQITNELISSERNRPYCILIISISIVYTILSNPFYTSRQIMSEIKSDRAMAADSWPKVSSINLYWIYNKYLIPIYLFSVLARKTLR